MAAKTNGFNGSNFEKLESRVMLTGAFPSAAQNAIVYDSKGNLDVAYYDSAAHNLKYVQQAANGTWSQPVVIDGSSKDVGKYVAIAISGSGFPAVAYQDTANSDLKFAQYNGTSWTTTTVDKRKTTGFNPSLAFDGAGDALISYYKQNTGDLDLATLKGKKWTLSVVASAGNVGQYSSIAIIPSTGKPAIAYSNTNGQVDYTAISGKSFTKPVSVGKATGSADVSLAFNGSTAAVGFVDTKTGNVKLGQVTGKTITTTTVATVTPGSGSGADVLIDPTTHQASVVYHDTTGVYIAAPSTQGTGFQTQQVSTDGSNTVATVQPGSGSIVFSTVSNTGGTLSLNTTVAPPNAPTNVAAAATSTTAASITWTDNSNNEAGFLIERGTDGVNFTTVATTQPNITSFADTGLTESTLYYYRVSAIGAAGNNTAGTTGSGGTQTNSTAVIATTTTYPAAATGVTATAVSTTGVTVNWTNNSHSLTGFNINRSTDGGTTWTQAASVGANVTTFSDTGLTEATNYVYQIVAYNSTGGTPAATAATYTLPNAPSSLSATATSNTAVTLTWQNNSAAATGYIIQRSPDGVNFTTVATRDASATSYADAGLAEATSYYYQVVTIGPGGQNSAASAPTNVTTDPSAPSNLTATALSPTRIDLAWTNNSQGATSYIVQRAANGGAFATITTLAGTATSYSDTGRTDGVSYSYRVQALSGSVASSFSAVIITTTLPTAPSSVNATANGMSVTLTWTNNSAGATSFDVDRSANNGATWGSIGTATPGASATITYTDAMPGQGGTYSYRVAAVNAAGPSTFANSQQSVTISPADPSGLTATATSSTVIALSWTDNSQGETGIFIERSADGGQHWTPVTTTAAFATTYPDNSLTPGTTYNYRISATNGGGASGYATAIGVTAPVAPVSLTATPASTNEIDLTWGAVSGATSYIVQRSTNGASPINLPPVTTTTYSDLNLTEGKQYQYTVTAVDAGGSSVPTAHVAATTLPVAPSNVEASGMSATSVFVTWTNNSNGATGFIVKRSSDDGMNWTSVTPPNGTTTNVIDLGVQESTTYIYQIIALDAGGQSAASVTAVPVTTVPLRPTNVVATAASASSIVLTWTNNSARATGYTIERGTDSANFTYQGSVNGSTSTFTDTQASAATTYYYRVYATGTGGASDYSDAAQATTTPAAPQNVTATATSATVVNLNWKAVTGASGYEVLRSTDDVSFHFYDTATTNAYSDTSAGESTQYWYEIQATNAVGNSVNSSAATAITSPSAPSSLAVTSITSSQVVLTWTNTSHAVTGFTIERSDDNNISWNQIDTAAADVTTYTDNSVHEGSHYIYRVRATGAGGPSAASTTIGADTNPAAPTGLTLSATSATTVMVSWTNVSTAATNYVVSRADNGGMFAVVATLGAGAHSDSDTVVEGGSYQYEVRATQTLVDGVTKVLSTWTGPQTVVTPPSAPNGVSAVAVSPTEVDVNWSNTSLTATGFYVSRSSDDVSWTLKATLPSSQTTYQDLTAQPGARYYYTISAYGATGTSAPSEAMPVTLTPPAPSNVMASTATNPDVTLTWSDVAGETGFNIYRSSDGSTPAAFVGTVGKNVLTFIDTTSVENQSYKYAVTAFNGTGESGISQVVSATTFLAAPTGLTITSTTSNEVDLVWTDNSAAASAYEVQRQVPGGMWMSLTTSLAADANSYNDTGVVDGVTYNYRVRALSTGGNSDFTQTASTATPLLAPTDLTVTTISTNQIDLSWTNPSATATAFQIMRSIDGGHSFQQIDAVDGTTYSDHDLTVGQSVSYEIVATGGGATSAATDATPAATLPAAPSNLDVEPIADNALKLTWQDNSDGATGYDIYRDSGDGNGLVYITTIAGADTNTFYDVGLNEATTYLYQIDATNIGGPSDSSNIAENTTLPAGPTNLTATSLSSSSIQLHWTDNSNGADGYTILMSSPEGYQPLPVLLGANAESYTVTGLSEATSYDFEVYAFNGSGPSTYSNPVYPTTLPAAPTLGAVTVQSDGVHLNWTNNSSNNSGGFQVQRSDNGGSTFDQAFTINNGAVTTYVDSSGAPNTSYVYQIVAVGVAGNSAGSSTSTVVTFPAAPTQFSASSTSSSSANLTWTPGASGAYSYDIKRSLDGQTFNYLTTINGPASSYTDNTAAAGKTYTYQLIANNSASDSATPVNAAPVSILTSAPTGTSTTSITATSVTLQWNDVQGETGFTVQSSPDNSTWTTLGSTSSGQTTYTDHTVLEAHTYYYRIAGTNASGRGDYSAGYSVLTLPAAPTLFTATAVSTTEVDLFWTDNSHGATLYDIYSAAGASSYMRIAHALASGTTSYQDLSASAGTNYSYQVVAYNATGPSTPVTQSALTFPGQPQSFRAIGASSSEIDLTWNQVASATQYTIERSPNGTDNWTQIAQPTGGTLSYQDKNLPAGTTYYYSITATNASGTGQAATTSGPTLPAAITSLSVSASSATQVHLSWLDTSVGATGYNVYRSDDSGANFNLLTTLNDPAANSYDDTVTEGTAHVYRVAPIDVSGEGAANDVSITTVPATPTLVSATAASSTEVDLVWTNNSASATGFTVERTDFGANTWVPLTDLLPGTATSYPDTTAEGGMQYQYKVIAQGAGGDSADSNVIAALTNPTAVNTLTVIAASTTEIDLSWTDVTGATTYRILRSLDGQHFTQADSISGPASSYQDTKLGQGLTEGTRYYYEVIANNATGDSAVGNTQYISTLPTAPSGLSLQVISNNEIDLSWTNNSTHQNAVGIERSGDNNSWSLQTVTTSASSTSTYKDMSVTGGKTYYYRISAVDEGGTNYMSDVASVSALTVPAGPTVTATPNTDGTVSLSWTTPTGATAFTVQRYDGMTWSDVVTDTSSTSTIDSSASGDVTYQYRALAIDASGSGPYGSSVSALTVPDAPSNLTATAASATQINLSWTGDTGSDVTYTIYRASGSGMLHFQKQTTVNGVTTYQDNGVSGGTIYTYEVVASNDSGQAVTPAFSSATTTFPAAASGFAATVSSDTEVDLSWTDSFGATSYTVSRKNGGSGWTLLTSPSLDSGAITYDDSTGSGGITYTYEITAINASGSTSSTITALTYPTAPTGLTPVVTDNHDISISWTASTGATSYTLQRSVTNSGTWNNVAGISGTTATDIVSGGTSYTYRIKATDATGDSAWAAADPVVTAPEAPTGVTVSAISDTAVHISWTASAGADSYVVQVANDTPPTWTDASGVLSSSTTSFNNTSLTQLTPYQYRVIATNAGGDSLPSSAQPVLTQPTPPSDLATTAVGSTTVGLSWTDNSDGMTAFDIQRSDVSGDNFTTIGTADTGVTTYSDSTAVAGTVYLYQIIADNGSVTSAPSSSLQVLTLPAAPTVSATAINAGEVDLSWNAPQSAASYTVNRKIGNGMYSQLATDVLTTSYRDMMASGGTQYTYQVIATNTTGDGSPGTSNTALTVPAAQADFSATEVSATEVTLNWTDVTGATSYTIERLTGSDDFSPITTPALGAAVHSYNDSTAQPGTSYTYEIFGTNNTGSSATTTISALTVPSSVAIATTTIVSTSEIDLTWTADAGTVDGYRVFRSDDNGPFVQLGDDLDNTVTSFNDTGLDTASDHVYRVVAFDATGQSANSDTGTLTTLTDTPTNFAATGVSTSQINLSWDMVDGATGYEVDVQDGQGWDMVTNTLDSNTFTYPAAGLNPGTSYTYRVEALDAGGPSVPTDPESGLTIPAQPTNIVGSAISATEVDLTWDAMTGAASYTLTVSTNGGSSYSSLANNVHGNSYHDMGAAPGTSHLFKVVAVDATGSSSAGTSSAVLTVPAAQTDFASTPISAGEVDLSWTDVTGATSYTIERKTGSDDFIPITIPALGGNIHTYADETPDAGTTYTYEIFGTDATGNSTATTLSALTMPGAVSIATTTVVSTSEIDLTWTADAGTVDGYRVFRSDDNGPFVQIGDDLDNSVTSFDDTGLDTASDHVYRVLAFNASGQSADNDTSTLTTLTDTPANFAATGVSSSQINLSWDMVDGATGYEVDVQDGQGWDMVTNTLDSNTFTYPATSLSPGTSYTYRVEALDAGGPSVPTDPESGLTSPAQPTTVAATAINATEVDLTWDAMTGAASYTLTVSTNGGMSYSGLATNVQASSYHDMTAAAGKTSLFKVVAVNATGSSSAGTSNSVLTVPAAQTDLAATAISAGEIDLNWTDVTGATSYTIERKTGSDDFSSITIPALAGNIHSFADHTVDPATSYTYEIFGTDATGNSITTTTSALTIPAAVSIATTTVISTSEIDLTWSADTGAVDGYRVYRSDHGADFAQVGDDLSNSTTSLNDTSLDAATDYVYRVVAFNATGESANSDTSSFTTLANTPGDFTVTGVSSAEIDLAWDAVSGATGYEVDRQDGQSWDVQTDELDASTLSYRDTSVSPGTSYTYRVEALDAGGPSVPTDSASGLTSPAAPTNVSATPISAHEVNLNWDNMTGADTYTITVSTDGGAHYSALADSIAGNSYQDMTATAGKSHLFQVVAVNATGSSDAGTSNAALTVPAAQTDVAATAISAGEIDLNWTDVTGATSYTIERKTGNGSFSAITIPALAGNIHSYMDTGASPATLSTYEIFGTDATGSSTTTTSSALTVPAAVSIPTTSIVSTSEIDLAWTADTGTISGYRVLRSDDLGMNFSQLGSDLPSSTLSYQDTTLDSATPYIYRVLAFNAAGHSGNSDTNTLTTLAETPGNFSVTGVSSSEIDLSWDAVSGATGYEVDRQNPDESWRMLTNTIDSSTTTYPDTTADAGTSYTYRVEALDDGGPSVPTTPASGLTIPAAPTNINATPINATEVDLNWDAMMGADTYNITVSTDGGAHYTDLADGISGNSYQDMAATAGKSHLFQIVAVDDTGTSSAGTSNAALTVPAAQANFAVTPISAGEVDLNWTDVTGATSYTIESKTGNGSFSPITMSPLAGNVHTYADHTVNPATSYMYEIFGTDATGNSTATTGSALTVPSAVAIATTTVVGTSEIDLTWTADTGTVSGYRVFRSDNLGMSFTQLGSDLSNSTTSYDDTSLSGGNTYIYRVLAFNATGHSGNSDSNQLVTYPDTPSGFSATSISATEIDVLWDSVNGATAYEVDRQKLDGTWQTLSNTIDPSDTSYPDTGLTPGTSYTYRMEAIDATGPSVATTSSIVSTRPDVVSDFAATVINGNEVDLSWTAVTGATSYHVMRDSGQGYVQIAAPATPGYQDTGLTENSSYSYEIIAHGVSGDGAATDPQSSTTYLNTPDLAVSGYDNGSITLTWTNHSLVDTGYLIEQQTGPSTWVDVFDGDALTDDADTASTTISSLNEATTYHFRVTALGDSGATSVATPVTAYTAPSDPTVINVTPVGTSEIDLTWTNNSASADSVIVQRSGDNGSTWSTIATLAGDASSYDDKTATEATAYKYQVAATKGTSTSNYDTSSSVTSLPLAPTSLTPSVASATEIDLTWTNNSAHATHYRVYRSSTNGSGYSQVGSDLASNATSYNDTTAPENQTSYYIVVAVDAGGESPSTATASATTPLSAPTSVMAATTSNTSGGDKTINLSWTNTSTVATNVKIERSSDGVNWTSIATLSPTMNVLPTSYSDNTALENVIYTYRVWAVDTTTSTASTHTPSNAITALLSLPTGLSLSSPTSDSVALTWNDVSASATSYHVERSLDGTHFTDIATLSSSSADMYTDSGRAEGTEYWYRVRAVSGSNTSNYSSIQSITTIPATPTTLVASPFSTTEIDLTWTAVSTEATIYTVEREDGTEGDWGVVPSDLTGSANSFSDTTVTEGKDYGYEVFATGVGGNSANSNVAAATSLPAAPSGVTLTSSSASSVSISWTDNSSGATNYEVQRGLNGTWSTLTTSLGASATSYTDSGVAEGTAYQYQVRASRNGTESAYSAPLNVTTQPAAPSALHITSTTASKVSLAWTDNSSGETGFKVERSNDGGTSWSIIGSPAANAHTFQDSGISEGSSYTYYVYAYNNGGNSTNSGTVTANIPPKAPSLLTATSVTPTSVSLSWTNNSGHQTGFYVLASTDGGSTYTQIANVTGSTTTYTDNTVTEDNGYQYEVKAYGTSGTSAASNSVSVTTPLLAPSDLTTTTASTTEIDLSWTINSQSNGGVTLQRQTGGGMWTSISLDPDATSYQDTGLTEGTTYTYQVQNTAPDTTLNSAFSATTTGTTLPNAPSAVSGTAASDTQVTVNWTNNSGGATGFVIQRSTDNSHWSAAGTAGAGATSFNDTGLSELTAYYYRVLATDAGGNSAWANSVSSVSTLPAAPSNLTLTPTSTKINLSWADHSAGATGYQVWRSVNGGAYSLYKTLAANANSYSDSTISEATTYGYQVRTVSSSLYSLYCPAQSLTTVPSAPTTLAATVISTTEVDLTWHDTSGGATHYLVERADNDSGTYVLIATLGSSANSYPDTSLTEGTDYIYRVRAQDAGGFSSYTGSSTVTTLPATPSNLLATPSSGVIALNWTDNSGGETSYTVQRFNSGTWTPIAILDADSTSFNDTGATGGLVSGTTYQYRVFCSNTGGNSGIISTSAMAV